MVPIEADHTTEKTAWYSQKSILALISMKLPENFSIWNNIPLVIWGKFNWNGEKKAIAIEESNMFLFYTDNKWRKGPLRTVFLEVSSVSSVSHCCEYLLRWQHENRCVALPIMWKHSQVCSSEMRVHIQLSIEKGTGSNMLKLFGDPSTHLALWSLGNCTENSPWELRSRRQLQGWSVLANTSIFYQGIQEEVWLTWSYK